MAAQGPQGPAGAILNRIGSFSPRRRSPPLCRVGQPRTPTSPVVAVRTVMAHPVCRGLSGILLGYSREAAGVLAGRGTDGSRVRSLGGSRAPCDKHPRNIGTPRGPRTIPETSVLPSTAALVACGGADGPRERRMGHAGGADIGDWLRRRPLGGRGRPDRTRRSRRTGPGSSITTKGRTAPSGETRHLFGLAAGRCVIAPPSPRVDPTVGMGRMVSTKRGSACSGGGPGSSIATKGRTTPFEETDHPF